MPQCCWLRAARTLSAVLLGAGRAKKGDPIDPAVGLVVHCKVGDELAAGAALFTVHASSSAALAAARAHALQGVAVVAGERVAALPLFYGVVVPRACHPFPCRCPSG